LKVFNRYLAANFIGPFFISTIFFVVFLLTFQLFRVMRIVISKGVEIGVILELLGHIALSFVPMATPLSVLFAMLYALNKLSEDSEIIAMRSFGLSKGKLLMPFFWSSLGVALTVFFLNQNIIPASKTYFKNSIIKLTSAGMINDIRPESFYHDIPGITLFAEKVEEGGKRMENIFIHSESKDGSEKLISAKSGSLVRILENEDVPPTLRLYLKDGNILKSDGKGELEKGLFYEYDFPLFEESIKPGFINKDNMKTTRDLRRFIRYKSNELKKEKNQAKKDSLLTRLYKAKLEYWTRINTPFQILLFALLGFCYGIKRGRGKERNYGVVIMALLVFNYALFFYGISLSKKGHMAPEVAIFLPTALLFLWGMRAFKRLDWLD